MIGSGKTTYARNLADDGTHVIVSHDDLTQMLHGRYRYNPDHRQMYMAMMMDLAGHALGRGLSVIADRTHLTPLSRLLWTSTAAIFKATKVAVVFPVVSPEEHARRRFHDEANAHRGRSYEEWLGVARHHAEQIAKNPITKESLTDEGFDEVIFL